MAKKNKRYQLDVSEEAHRKVREEAATKGKRRKEVASRLILRK